ncbi:MAG: ParA family protein, partial [Chitinophagaceae bacterium]|nr:ParA family protein [Rubrivivax sp.]
AAAEKRPARILLNRVPATGRLKQQIAAELAARGLHTLGAGLGNRTAFTTAFMQGLAVTEAAPRGVAGLEVMASLEALLPLMKENR